MVRHHVRHDSRGPYERHTHDASGKWHGLFELEESDSDGHDDHGSYDRRGHGSYDKRRDGSGDWSGYGSGDGSNDVSGDGSGHGSCDATVVVRILPGVLVRRIVRRESGGEPC